MGVGVGTLSTPPLLLLKEHRDSITAASRKADRQRDSSETAAPRPLEPPAHLCTRPAGKPKEGDLSKEGAVVPIRQTAAWWVRTHVISGWRGCLVW